MKQSSAHTLLIEGGAETPNVATPPAAAAKPDRSKLIGALGNFGIQYNLSSLSIAIPFMTSAADVVVTSSNGLSPDFPQPEWSKYVLIGAVFAGTICGMLTFGYIGDVLGRRKGMLLTLAFVVFGILFSSLLSWGDATYYVLCISRFFMGFGVGGMYPLSFAAVAEGGANKAATAEAAAAVGGNDKDASLGWAYFYQMPGSMAPYLVGLILLALPAFSEVTSLQFRLILGLGLLPSLLMWWTSYKSLHDAPVIGKARRSSRTAEPASPLQVARQHPELFRTLIGTAGGWMAYDLSYYGTALFTPDILNSIFGNEDLVNLCWHSLVISGISIPATLLTIYIMRFKGAKWITVWGFLLLAAVYAGFGAIYIPYPNKGDANVLKFVAFCMLSFALSLGPSVGVHVLASKSYPTAVRASFIGLSAAGGKVGALIGTFMFKPIEAAGGTSAVLFVQAAVAVAGLFVVALCIKPDPPAKAAPKEAITTPLLAEAA